MFCNNCGSSLNGNEQFCANCGAKVESKAQKPEEMTSTPVAEPVAEPVVEEVAETVVTEEKAAETVIAEPVLEEKATEEVATKPVITPKKKSKRGLWLGLGIASIIVAVLAAIVALNFSSVKNFVKKTVSSDEDYFKYVQEQQGDDIAESLAEAISKLVEGANNISGDKLALKPVSEKMTFKVNKPVIDFVEKLAGGNGVDLDWLNGADAVIDMVYDGKDKVGMDIGLNINGKEITTAKAVCDYSAGKVYMVLPDINNQYVYVDISAVNDRTNNNNSSNSMVSGGEFGYLSAESAVDSTPSNALAAMDFSVFTKNLPEQKELEKLLNKYISLILDNIEEVEKENDTIEVGDLTCKCTKYTVEIDEELLRKVFKAVLTELKNDEVVKQYIIKTAEELDEDGDEVYDSFKDTIKDALDSIDELKSEDFDYSIWVDSNGNIVSLLIGDGTFDIEYKSVEKGNKFATEFSIGDKETKLGFKNEGEVKDGRLKSETRFIMNDTTYLVVEADNVDPDKQAKDEFSGTLTISLGQGLRDMIKMSGDELLAGFADAKLIISCDAKENDAAKIKLAVNLKSDEWVSIELEGEYTESQTVEIPTNYVDSTNEAGMQNWLKTAKFDKLLDNLTQANVPAELVSQLRNMTNQLR